MEVKQTALDLLKNIAEEQKYEDSTVAIEEVCGVNVMSALFRMTLSAPGKPHLKLFAKVATATEQLRKELSFRPYNIELYFYTKLRNIYKTLEEKHSVPEEYRIHTPKLYGVRDEYLSETLLFEDLEAQGFNNFNREKSADMEYMSAGIDLMAQLHALSMSYHQDDPEGFRRASEILAIKEAMFGKFIEMTKRKSLANAFEAAEGEHRVRLERYFNDHPERFRLLLNNYRCHNRNILVHGDFKPSNLMHRRRNGKLEMVIMDFQMVHDGDPVGELMYFIFTATDEQFRRVHYHALLEQYYERLRVALLNLHLDPEQVYSENAYRAQLEKCTMLGLVIAVAMLPVVLVEEDKAPGFNTKDADWSDLAVKPSALFKERFNGVVNNYVEWGLL